MNLTEDNLPQAPFGRRPPVLRVSANERGCAKWKVRCGRDAYKWTTAPGHLPLRLRGLFCSVEQDGELRLGDSCAAFDPNGVPMTAYRLLARSLKLPDAA